MNSVTCHLPHEFIADENILAQIGEDSQEDRKFFYDQQQSGKKNSSEEKFQMIYGFNSDFPHFIQMLQLNSNKMKVLFAALLEWTQR